MKTYLLAAALLLPAPLLAQEQIPAGTILPVQLNNSLRSNKLHSGETITGRIMQDVPLDPAPQGARRKINAGAKVVGHVVAAKPAAAGFAAELSVRFDTVTAGKEKIAVKTNLRALASMMDVSDAQDPQTGPDRGTSAFYWVTTQIGGETVYGGGGPVTHGLDVVGESRGYGSVVGHVAPNPKAGCRGEVAGDDRLQALWLFASDACGLYDFPDLELVHAGRTDPAGEIQLRAKQGEVNVRAGSGMLLRVN